MGCANLNAKILQTLKWNYDGKQRTVHSIRHTAISQALRRNVSLNAISKNAGVSIDTLTRAYDHTQSSDYIMESTKHDYTGFDDRR
mgnify:CR=1